MDDEQTNRRLAAILAADVVGYSRMMAADEDGTLAALKRHRETAFDPAVERHHGRIVKLIGDGTLVEFASVVDALKCALAIQQAAHGEEKNSASGIVLRIGVNLGDVIVDGDDIYGDGVNVAARLEPLAEPGGICIASIVNESVGTRIDATFRDGGEVRVKNIDRPIRVWKWHPSADAARTAAPRPQTSDPGEQPAESPSIAVLPFDNMSGDPEQEYFSNGITEDIITDLSKVGGLLVIARNSSFTYKGKSVDVRTVGRELGVTSVLEGSVRRAGDRVRITAQLIDTTTAGHLWAERYDRDLTDIFAVQDDVTRQIVDALKVTLTPSEMARIADTGTTNVEAHDYFLRGRELMFGLIRDREIFDHATACFRRAIELDPNYGAPYAGLAMAYMLDHQNRWSESPETSLDRADRFVRDAIEREDKDPFAHYVAAVVAMFQKDYDRWADEVDRALALNPNHALALNARGILLLYTGEPAKAIPYIERAMRLDPAFQSQFIHFLGTAHFVGGDYEAAAASFRDRIAKTPSTDLSRAFLASALGHLNRPEEARRIWRELKDINPEYSHPEHVDRLPFRDPADAEKFTDGLRKVGLPD